MLTPSKDPALDLDALDRLRDHNLYLKGKMKELQERKRQVMIQDSSSVSMKDKLLQLKDQCQRLQSQKQNIRRNIRRNQLGSMDKFKFNFQLQVLKVSQKYQEQMERLATSHRAQKTVLENRLLQTQREIRQNQLMLQSCSQSDPMVEAQIAKLRKQIKELDHCFSKLEDPFPKDSQSSLYFSNLHNSGGLNMLSNQYQCNDSYLGRTDAIFGQIRRSESRGSLPRRNKSKSRYM